MAIPIRLKLGLGVVVLAALSAGACSSSSGSGTGAGTTSSSANSATASAGSGGASTSSTTTTTTTGSGGATTSSSTTTTSSSSSGTCATQPTADPNALACPGGLCAIGDSGYDFVFMDPGPMTTICLAKDTPCVAGTLTAANPPAYTYYGAGIGINLAPTDGGTAAPVQLSGTGITVKLSNLPPGGARVQVTVGTQTYCAALTTNPATITWAEFNSKCYDSPPDGTALTAAPATPSVEITLPSGGTEQTFDFCIEQITLTTQ